MPEGFHLVEAKRGGFVRLNPSVVIGEIGWKALLMHADDKVKALAKKYAGK